MHAHGTRPAVATLAVVLALTGCDGTATPTAAATSAPPSPDPARAAVCRTAVDHAVTAVELMDEYGWEAPDAAGLDRLDTTVDGMEAVQKEMPAPLGSLYVSNLISPLALVQISAALGRPTGVIRTDYARSALRFDAECTRWAVGGQ